MASVNMHGENLRWPFTSVGVLFSITFAILALGIIPACGRGTGVLIAAAFGFYGIGLFFWPAVAFVLANLKSVLAKCLVVTLFITHYGFLCVYLRSGGIEEGQRIVEAFSTYPQYMVPPAILYLVAHALIWVLFIRGIVVSRNTPSNNSLQVSAG